MKLWKKLVEGWELRVARAKDYIIRGGELYGDLFMTILGCLVVGFIFGQAVLLYNLGQDISYLYFGSFISIAIMAGVVTNIFVWIIPPIKKYEKDHGPTNLGKDWLMRKRGKTEEETELIRSRYWDKK